MQKVTYKFTIRDKNNKLRYKQNTVFMDVPTDEYGYILMNDLFKKIQNNLKKSDTLKFVKVHEAI